MPATDAATPVLPGEILAGKYRIERLLGEGAMGTVVAARHLLLEQDVAIKFLRPELAKEAGVAERFRREGKAAARIKGEHVVRVFDVGELEGGLPYLVMEYVEGMNLAEVIAAEGVLPTAAAVDYILQACDALAQAHAAGVVHRDVKPSNLFVSHRPDGRPLVKVLDFGISKVSGAEAAMTHPTALMGSPLYMSPEQLLSSRDVDGRSDIWSLGIVLYELLTGALPFVADTIPQICMQIQDAPAPSPRKLRPEIPESVEAVILRCLQKDPASRFATISDLVSALKLGAGARHPAGTGTRLYPSAGTQLRRDASVPTSFVGGGSQRESAARDEKPSSRRTMGIVAVASGALLSAAVVVTLISVSRAGKESLPPPGPTPRVERPSAVPVSPPLPPPIPANGFGGSLAIPAPLPSPSPSSSRSPSRILPPSRDTTTVPHRSGIHAQSKSRSNPPQKKPSPRPLAAPQSPLPAVPTLPGDRK